MRADSAATSSVALALASKTFLSAWKSLGNMQHGRYMASERLGNSLSAWLKGISASRSTCSNSDCDTRPCNKIGSCLGNCSCGGWPALRSA